MKKILAIILVLVMVMGLSTAAFAAAAPGAGVEEGPTTDLTITDGTGYNSARSYAGYQLFTATVNEAASAYSYKANEKYLSIIQEVLGVAENNDKEVVLANVLAAIAELKTAEQIRHFADDIYTELLKRNIAPDKTWNTTSVKVAQGYWLVADVTNLDGSFYSNSLVMVDTVGTSALTVTNKPATITTGKRVDDENDSVVAPDGGNEDAVNWQFVGDYDIGDEVPYSITGQLPSNVSEYDYYVFMIGDYLDQGLTFIPDSFEFFFNGTDEQSIGVKGTENVDFWYEIVTENDGNGKQLSQKLYLYPAHDYTTHELDETTTDDFNDYVVKKASKDNGGDVLPLIRDDDHSKMNSSTFTFNYSCLLNENAIFGSTGNENEYELFFSNNPYGDSMGKTLPVTNIVFTFKAMFNKVDGQGNPLTGADFDVYKFVALKAPTEEQIAAAVDLVSLDTAEATDAAATNKTVVKHPASNSYGYLVELTHKSVNAEGTSFSFAGLDDGYYRLVEAAVPAGYNGIDPIDFHLIVDHDMSIGANLVNNPIINSISVTTRVTGEMSMTADIANGTVSANIENHSGNELPSTGGVGTTIFYILGSVMVLAAVVVLITKKRMSAEG